MGNYRIKYKNGALEIEVESTDKAYVDNKLSELLSSPSQPAKQPRRKTPNRRQSAGDSTGEDSGQLDVPAIVDAINDSDDHEAIDRYILSKSAQLPRIILCLKFASTTQDSPLLTTGNIETITNQLNIRISNANAANAIKKNLKYFNADSVRKRGATVKYKLNRKGLTAYGTLLKGETPS